MRGKGFSVACDGSQAKNMRHAVKLDSDGDIEFPCDEDGYTMKKCLDVFDLQGEHDRPLRERHDRVNAEGKMKISQKKKKCSKKCYLGPKKTFFICTRKTCKISNKKLLSTYKKVLKSSTRKTKTKTKTKKSNLLKIYKRVTKKARGMLKHRRVSI